MRRKKYSQYSRYREKAELNLEIQNLFNSILFKMITCLWLRKSKNLIFFAKIFRFARIFRFYRFIDRPLVSDIADGLRKEQVFVMSIVHFADSLWSDQMYFWNDKNVIIIGNYLVNRIEQNQTFSEFTEYVPHICPIIKSGIEGDCGCSWGSWKYC